jgi:hypothetical protein
MSLTYHGCLVYLTWHYLDVSDVHFAADVLLFQRLQVVKTLLEY